MVIPYKIKDHNGLICGKLPCDIQSTPDNSNLALTLTKIDFPWICVIRLL